MSKTNPKILVIRGGAIGDFILTLPVIAALRAQFPGVHLEVLGYPHIVQLAVAGGLVDRAQPIEARTLAAYFARDGALDKAMQDYFASFDIIISYLYDPDEIFLTNVRRSTKSQYISGPHRPDESEKLHAAKVFLKPLERLAIFEPDSTPHLAINYQLSTLNQLALHPGSGSDQKNWPEANWFELIRELVRSTNYNFVLVGGEAEGDRLKRLAAEIPATRCQIAQSLPLVELAGRLRACAAFVGHDSGITHLAAALGLPCLVLWAHSLEEIWRPLGTNVSVIREQGGIEKISVQRVLSELAALPIQVR